MELIEVRDKQTRKDFLHLPLRIYDDDSAWIRPLDKDIEEVFDPDQNKFFRHGKATRWILRDSAGSVIGRIGAFVNEKTARKFDQPTGGCGFFECIDDEQAAHKLFDKAKEWLEKQGMEAMDGPTNFGERNEWWGLLVDGFDREPNYKCNYQPPYYRKLFESYGFKIYFKQFTYGRPVQGPLDEKFQRKAARIKREPGYHFKHIEKKRLKKYAEDFTYIYNKAWSGHKGVKKIKRAQAMHIMNKIKRILDEDIVWYAYYKDEPIGFFIVLPELNQIFKYVNGKLNWIGKLKFLWHQWRGTCRKIFGVVFGIIPEHRKKGVEGAMINAMADHVQPMDRYDYFEMNWIGDFNPKMMHIAEAVGGNIVKTHHTYRKLFDESQPFERAPVMD